MYVVNKDHQARLQSDDKDDGGGDDGEMMMMMTMKAMKKRGETQTRCHLRSTMSEAPLCKLVEPGFPKHRHRPNLVKFSVWRGQRACAFIYLYFHFYYVQSFSSEASSSSSVRISGLVHQ